MSYLEKVWSRAGNWGGLLLVVGAAVCLAAGQLSRFAPEARRETAAVALKAAGLAVALAGALRIFEIF